MSDSRNRTKFTARERGKRGVEVGADTASIKAGPAYSGTPATVAEKPASGRVPTRGTAKTETRKSPPTFKR